MKRQLVQEMYNLRIFQTITRSIRAEETLSSTETSVASSSVSFLAALYASLASASPTCPPFSTRLLYSSIWEWQSEYHNAVNDYAPWCLHFSWNTHVQATWHRHGCEYYIPPTIWCKFKENLEKWAHPDQLHILKFRTFHVLKRVWET